VDEVAEQRVGRDVRGEEGRKEVDEVATLQDVRDQSQVLKKRVEV
jgi:hypothetical protein